MYVLSNINLLKKKMSLVHRKTSPFYKTSKIVDIDEKGFIKILIIYE